MLKKTVIYVFGPRRLANCYVQDDLMDLSIGGWLKIGETTCSQLETDNREVALKRINGIAHTGIPEPCQLLDVFEYPCLYSHMDNKIRRILTDTHNLDSSIQYNQDLNYENYEIKAGNEFVYGVSRKQVLNAIARFERDLILEHYETHGCDIMKSLLANQELVRQNGPSINDDSNSEEQSSFFDKLWTDVSGGIKSKVQSNCSIPKGRAYMFLKSRNHKDLFFYTIGYSVRAKAASVSIETFGGEEAKRSIENMIANSSIDSPLRELSVKQGVKNKNKWAWSSIKTIDKSDEGLVSWYVGTTVSLYESVEIK